MQQMFELADQEGVNIRWYNFVQPIRGMYWDPIVKPPVIFLDNTLAKNNRLLRCVMAEELGHHFTLDRDCLYRTYYNYRDRLDVSRAEYRALRWAAKHLIPQEKLEKLIRSGIVQKWEIAEAFNVVEELIPYRMAMPDAVRALYGNASSY